ncbi:MerR family transcriptional regulator [Streptomyces sp. NPDC097619]|uniref:MerR family transcriptional regulator n=1 Tax=Streptomyces sp. NPDC097619 TaxID=3157228 RepID=UPI003321CA22
MAENAHGMTTGAVARRLGVSPTTLRSWDQRYGIGPAVREDGRHRRWAPADVAVLEEMCRLTASGVAPAEAARAARAGGEGTVGGPGATAAAASTGRSTAPDPGPRPTGTGTDGTGAGAGTGGTSARTRAGDRGSGTDGTTPGPAAPGAGPHAPVDAQRELRGLARAAVRLDSPALDAQLRALLTVHGLVASWEQVIMPALHAAGRRWESSDDRYVEVEHLLSWHVSTALRQLVSAARPREAGTSPVLLACAPGEQHTLSLEALAAGLAERGVATRMFGAAVPAEALDAAVRRLGPAAVVLWSQSRSTASHALARHVADTAFGVKGARTHPVVLLAGPGWAGRPVGPGMLRPGGLREALALLHTPPPTSPVAALPTPTDA